MTREEAVQWNNNTHDSNFFDNTDEMEESIYYLIKKIYDDFENRICSNCKHWKVRSKIARSNECNKLANNVMTSNDFGCNWWESK